MSVAANANDELFDGGLLLRWEQSLGLVKSGRPLFTRCALLAVLVGYLPLAILAAAQLLIFSNPSAISFFFDFAVHARFLLAVPTLILAEKECTPRLGQIVNHFAKSGLITGPDTARFQAAVSSTRRLLDSSLARLGAIALAYLVAVTLALFWEAVPVWHQQKSANGIQFSPVGWWHIMVSLPLFLVILFGWLWRLSLWGRFLFLMSRLDLRLIPSHSDRVGGLKFVTSSLRSFRLISLALGAVVAGAIANRQVHQGADLFDFKYLVAGLLIFLLCLFAGPLTLFFSKLRETKRRGIFEYGALIRAVGRQFETRWIRDPESIDDTSLQAPDFSATTDLYSIASNVYAMQFVPFSTKDLIGPIGVSALIPFIPLLLLAIPLDVIALSVAKLLF